MTTETTATARIRWEATTSGSARGYVGSMDYPMFRILKGSTVGRWYLDAGVLGHYGHVADDPADPEALKPKAEHWLEDFVSSLGAVFPDRLRAAILFERDAHNIAAGDEGDCSHPWRPETSCGAASALDWVLVKIGEATPSVAGTEEN